MRSFLLGIAPAACLFVLAVVVAGCGGSDGANSDGSNLSDASAAEGGAGHDAGTDGTPGADATTGDDGSTAGEGGGADGPVTKAGDAGGDDATTPSDAPSGDDSTDGSGDDSGDAESGAIIIVGDDGPGDLEAGVIVYSPCGPTLLCNVQTEFCFHTEGPHAVDGGVPMTWACKSVPSQCLTNPPTCACLASAGATGGCMCEVQGALTVTCLYP
jgi:hypothetical protein